MSINEDWDVEQHKVEHESDEHWELRRKFLLTHKDKFSEDKLVCLAQVFVNVELLGCRYPKETMDLVKELSQDLAAEFREKQKRKLQRTFVEASQAASSKVKGYPIRTSVTEEHMSNTVNDIDQSCKKLDTKKLVSNITKRLKLNTTSCNSQLCKEPNDEESPSKRLKTEKNNASSDNPYRDIVLWERLGDVSQNILGTSVNISGSNLEWKYTEKEGMWECAIYINTKKLSHCTNSNKKVAKSEAATIALNELRQYCYTIKVKSNLDAKSNLTVTTKEMQPQEHTPDNNWKASDCIGGKLMKMMGWTGGGLGKSEQGNVKLVSAMLNPKISREGLGLKSNSCTTPEMKAKCQKLFKDFLKTDMQNDIVFVNFTNEERAVIHQIARTMGLKSRSYGTTVQRKLLVSRKIDVRSLVKELINLGGVTEKYELVKPTDEKFVSKSFLIDS